MEVNGILGLIVLLLDIFALFKIIQSSASTGKKVIWALVVLILPVIGLIIWFIAGPGDKQLKI